MSEVENRVVNAKAKYIRVATSTVASAVAMVHFGVVSLIRYHWMVLAIFSLKQACEDHSRSSNGRYLNAGVGLRHYHETEKEIVFTAGQLSG